MDKLKKSYKAYSVKIGFAYPGIFKKGFFLIDGMAVC